MVKERWMDRFLLRWIVIAPLAACGDDERGEDSTAGDTTAADTTAAATTSDPAGTNPCTGPCEVNQCCQWISGEVGFVDYACQGGAWVILSCPAEIPEDGASCLDIGVCTGSACNYTETCGEATMLGAMCTDDGTWSVDASCG